MDRRSGGVLNRRLDGSMVAPFQKPVSSLDGIVVDSRSTITGLDVGEVSSSSSVAGIAVVNCTEANSARTIENGRMVNMANVNGGMMSICSRVTVLQSAKYLFV